MNRATSGSTGRVPTRIVVSDSGQRNKGPDRKRLKEGFPGANRAAQARSLMLMDGDPGQLHYYKVQFQQLSAAGLNHGCNQF